ncbi:hypothetical protein [Arenibacterium sp. LLYu02]|uniref:hypothetical protein n=1 Tax=Arenibacterium sp. LLYu02 TaxID=3404132 RepID=UPI003B2198FB
MTHDPDGWRSDSKILRWVELFFAEMSWSLDEDAPAVLQGGREDFDGEKAVVAQRLAAAVARIPASDADLMVKLRQIAPQLEVDLKAADTAELLANVAEKLTKFDAAVEKALRDHATALEGRRSAAQGELAKVKNSPVISAAARRGFDRRHKGLAQEIGAEVELAAFDAIDAKIVSLANDIAAEVDTEAARPAAEAAVSQAQARAAALAAKLDRGALLYVNGEVAKLLAALAKATDKARCEQLVADCATFTAMTVKAEAYGAYFDTWFKTSAALIATHAVKVKETWEHRNDAVKQATAESEQGRFDQAKAALEVFNARTGDESVGGQAAFDGTAGFIDLVDRLEADYGDKLDEVTKSSLKGAAGQKKAIADIRKQGVASGDIPGATARIDPLKAWIDGNLPLARAMAGFHSSALKLPGYRQAITAMEVKRTAEKWVEALAELDVLKDGSDLAVRVESISVNQKLANSYAALFDRVANNKKAQTGLKQAWDAHKTAAEATPGDPATMKATLAELRKWMLLDEIYDGSALVKAVLDGSKGSRAYGYTAPALALINNKDFVQGLAETKAVLPRVKALAAYLDVRKEAEALMAALPVDPPELRALIETALDATKTTAKGGDAQTALADLRAAMVSPEVQELALAVADYTAYLARVEAEHARVLGFVVQAEAEKALTDSLNDAKAKADPGGDFAGGYDALAGHHTLLSGVRAYATRRMEALNTIGALKRAVAQDSTWEAQIFASGGSVAAMESDFAKADALGAGLDFAKAQSGYEQIIAGCTAAMNKTVDLYELADAVDSNAGHSRDSHGAQVTEAEHLKRLTEGIAPGNRASKTNTSSSFHSDSDWLAGREIGAQRAAAAGVDVNGKSLPWPGPEPVAQKFIIDHGRAIDTAYRGVRPKQTYDAGADEFRDTGTYETYEVLTGLTRALVNFIWECDKFGGTKYRTLAEYAAAHAGANGGVDPTSIPGRWVMMQQFPWAEDWNQAEQRYDKPIT